MLRTILLAAISLLSFGQHAASQVSPLLLKLMKDDSKTPFMKDNFDYDGTPYYNDKYSTAQLTDVTGVVYFSVKIKLDLAGHKIQYICDNGDELLTDIPMKKIKFIQYPVADGQWSDITLISYDGPINTPGSSVYQVIDSGKISLLEKINIDYHDENKYGMARPTRAFERRETWEVLLPGGEIRRVEKGKAAVVALFPDKQKQVETFIEQNKLKCNAVKDYEKVIMYYNSL